MPVHHISSFVSNFRRDREGAVAVIVALAFPVLVGVLGLGTEVGYWYKVQADMQRAVDLATHAGAVELAESGDEDKAIQAAYSAALLNGVDAGEIEVSLVELADSEAISVTAHRHASRYFSGLLVSDGGMDIAANATGRILPERFICILALGPGGDGITAGGSASVDANGCSIHSNSTGSTSVTATGSSFIRADCISMAGSSPYLSTRHYTLGECPNLEPGLPEIDDPYADITPPNLGLAPFNNLQSSRRESQISSGRYDSMEWKDNVQIDDGATIVIDGGRLYTTGTTSITGTGVTIFLINGARLDIGSNTTMSLTAKNSGDYAGLVFVGDRTANTENHRFRGGAGTSLQGAVYLPTGRLDMAGGTGVTNGCTHLIAYEFDFIGNSGAANNCDSVGVRAIRLNKMAGFGFVN